VVVWGGSNDIARNNSIKGMKNILEFVLNANHTNVIIMNAPHRQDLISCVNVLIRKWMHSIGSYAKG